MMFGGGQANKRTGGFEHGLRQAPTISRPKP